jgi:hypothetical protein
VIARFFAAYEDGLGVLLNITKQAEQTAVPFIAKNAMSGA